MATKRPLCNYAGDIKELALGDNVPDISGVSSLPYWQINVGEVVSVGERQEYAINSGFFENNGELILGEGAILFISGIDDVYAAWKIMSYESKTVGVRQEYSIHNGLFDNRGELILNEDSILYVGV